jgi:hypothetical protein
MPLRVVVAAALGVDAAVHLMLAANYQLASPGGIGAGTLFRGEAVIAVLAGIYVLLRGSRAAFTVAFIVTVSALIAVLVYRFVDFPQIGPIPSMYEPTWYFAKTSSAIAEAVGALLSGVALATHRRRTTRT